MRIWTRLPPRFKENGVKDKAENVLSKVVMIEMLRKIKKLVKNSSIQMKIWTGLPPRFKENGVKDKVENMENNKNEN